MASKSKRRTKHRGNAAGIVEARGRTSRPAADAPRRSSGSGRGGGAAGRALKPATWQRAAIKAAGFALLLFVLTQVGIFGRNQTPAAGALLAAMSLLLYTPIVYATDRWAYTRDQRRRQGAGRRG